MFSYLATLALSAAWGASPLPATQEGSLLPTAVFYESPPRLRDGREWNGDPLDDLPPVNLGRGEDNRLIGERLLLHRQPTPFLRNPVGYLADLFGVDSAELRAALDQVFPRPVPVRWSLSHGEGGARREVWSGTEALVPGGVQVVREFTRHNRVAELDVEIAMASSIADPVVDTFFEGAGLLLAVDVQGDGSCRLEWVLRRSEMEPREPIHLDPSPLGDGERNGFRFAEAGGVATLSSEDPLEVTLSDGGGETWQLRIEADTSAQRTRATAGSLEVLYAPTLFEGAVGLLHPPFVPLSANEGMDLRDGREPEGGDLDEVVGRLVDRGALDPDELDLEDGWAEGAHLEGRGLLLLAGSSAALGDALGEVVGKQASSHRVVLDLHYHDAARSKSGTAGFHADVVANTPVAFGIGRARQYLTDWDVEVAQASRIPDPLLSFVDEGIRGDLRVLADDRGEPWALALDLEVARIHGHESTRLKLGPGLQGGTMASTLNESTTILEVPPMPAPVVPIETVSRSEQRVQGRFLLNRDGGAWTIEPIHRSAHQLLGEGGSLRIEARVE